MDSFWVLQRGGGYLPCQIGGRRQTLNFDANCMAECSQYDMPIPLKYVRRGLVLTSGGEGGRVSKWTSCGSFCDGRGRKGLPALGHYSFSRTLFLVALSELRRMNRGWADVPQQKYAEEKCGDNLYMQSTVRGPLLSSVRLHTSLS
jgi:hypothetical protein